MRVLLGFKKPVFSDSQDKMVEREGTGNAYLHQIKGESTQTAGKLQGLYKSCQHIKG